MPNSVRYLTTHSALGQLLIAASGQGVCDISLGDDANALSAELATHHSQVEHAPHDAQLQAACDELMRYLDKPDFSPSFVLDLQGTPFQQSVWAALRNIPRGHTISYRQLAEKIAHPNAFRAAGSACAANRLAIVIPCHRVAHTNGDLAGYRWGLERKVALLVREHAALHA